MDLDTLLQQAMELEKAQAMIYKGLEKKFSLKNEISQFWAEMAKDEEDHCGFITKMRDKLEPDQLSITVERDLCDLVRNGLDELRPSRLNEVFDLDDACNLAHEVENYETEAVLKFIESRFKNDSHRLEISNLILAHLNKLSDFSEQFSSAAERKSIKADIH